MRNANNSWYRWLLVSPREGHSSGRLCADIQGGSTEQVMKFTQGFAMELQFEGKKKTCGKIYGRKVNPFDCRWFVIRRASVSQETSFHYEKWWLEENVLYFHEWSILSLQCNNWRPRRSVIFFEKSSFIQLSGVICKTFIFYIYTCTIYCICIHTVCLYLYTYICLYYICVYTVCVYTCVCVCLRPLIHCLQIKNILFIKM